MKRKLPLQLSIFFLLFLFTIAGKSIEGSAFLLRQDTSLPTIANPSEAQSLQMTAQKNNAALSSVTTQEQNSSQLSGDIVAINGSTVFLKNGNDQVRAYRIPSNAYVFRNGIDATYSSLAPNDYLFATMTNDNLIRMTAFSKPLIDLARVLLITSIIATAYFITVFVLRKLTQSTTSLKKLDFPGHPVATS